MEIGAGIEFWKLNSQFAHIVTSVSGQSQTTLFVVQNVFADLIIGLHDPSVKKTSITFGGQILGFQAGETCSPSEFFTEILSICHRQLDMCLLG